MDEARGTGRGARVPAGVLGMLALVVAVESFVSHHERDAIAPEDWQYLRARRETARLARGCDLLILGDSQAKFGVIPRVLEARGRLRSYNLAIWGAQAPTSYRLLRRALEGGARPSAVVVDFYPLLLAKPPRATRAHLPFLLDPPAALRLGFEARDPTLIADLATRSALPTWRCRTPLRAWVRASIAGRPNRYRALADEALDHWDRNDGALLFDARSSAAVGVAAHRRLAYPRGWKADRVNAEYIRRFLQLAESRGVAVYWLLPPVHPALQAANEAVGFDARYEAFVRLQLRRFPNLVVIDGRHAGYDPGAFVDLDHLAREGAVALSAGLGDLLGGRTRAPSPGRWLALPGYRPGAADPATATVAARLDILMPEPVATTVR